MYKPFIFMLLVIAALGSSCTEKCRKLNCENNGNCYDGQCICTKWYSGETCQLSYNRNYTGVYTGYESVNGDIFSRTVSVTADEEIPNRMMIDNGVYFEYYNDSLFLIPLQTLLIDSTETLLSGQGTYSLNKIDFRYDVQVGGEGSLKPSGEFYSFSGNR